MNLITQNPYRVLGLLGNSSERELQKQIATIKRYAEVGKIKQFDYDFDFLGKVSRTSNDVQKAASQIEQANNKLHYSLFWFVNKSHIDETALNHLKENNPDKAIEIWEKTIKDGEVTPKSLSSITNLATLLLGISVQNGKLDKTKFQQAIDLKGKLIHSDTFQDFVSLTTGNGFSADTSKLSSAFTDDILSITKKYIDKEGGITNAELIQSFGSFPESTRKYLASKFIEEPQSRIESNIENIKEQRKSEPEKANKWGSALYTSTRTDLTFLKKVLGSNNVQYQMLANKLANELLQCAIDYFIEWRDDHSNDPGQESLRVAKFAKSIATSGQAKNRIEENIENIEEWIEEAPERQRQGAIQTQIEFVANKLKSFQSASDSITTAQNLVTSCKPKLNEIKSVLGSTDDFYIQISTAVANNALGMLISVVNREQEKLKYDRVSAIISLPTTISSALSVTNQIGSLDMDSDSRSRYNENKRTLSSLNTQLQQVQKSYSSSSSSSSGGGCYIATMAYGDYDHPQVMTLRKFRDERLANTFIGRAFIRFYYSTSPKLVALLKNQKQINRTIRLMLDQIIKLIRK